VNYSGARPVIPESGWFGVVRPGDGKAGCLTMGVKPHVLAVIWLSRILYYGRRGQRGSERHHLGYADPWPS
jgi:hypothetical protein